MMHISQTDYHHHPDRFHEHQLCMLPLLVPLFPLDVFELPATKQRSTAFRVRQASLRTFHA